MKKAFIALFAVCFVTLSLIAVNCGRTVSTSPSDSTDGGNGATTITVKGLAETTGKTTSGIKTRNFLNSGTASVVAIKDDGTKVVLGTGEVSNGIYSVNINPSDIPSDVKVGNDFAVNLLVTATSGAVSIGSIVPSIKLGSPETYGPPANEAGKEKRDMAEQILKDSSISSNSFNPLDFIDRTVSDTGLTNLNEDEKSKLTEALLTAVKDSSKIAEGLGISSQNFSSANQSEMTTGYQNNLEPLYKSAVESKTSPSSTQISSAAANSYDSMNNYYESQGYAGQQVSDLKNMTNQWSAAKMQENGISSNDEIYKTSRGRMIINSGIGYCLAIYDAVDILNKATNGSVESWATKYPASYEAYKNCKSAILSYLNSLDESTVSLEAVQTYIRDNFFEKYIAPPVPHPSSLKTSSTPPIQDESNETIYNQYKNNIRQGGQSYFVATFFTLSEFQSWGPKINDASSAFQNRANNVTTDVLKGENITQFKETLTTFNTTLDTASSALATYFTNYGFNNASEIANAFRITTSLLNTYFQQ